MPYKNEGDDYIYTSMPYNDKTGLVHVTEFEKSEPCYSFDTFMVLFNPENKMYYYGEDSGCSCPSPFDGFSKISDYEGPFTKQQMINIVREAQSKLDTRKTWVMVDGVEIEKTEVEADLLDSLLASVKHIEEHAELIEGTVEQKALPPGIQNPSHPMQDLIDRKSLGTPGV